MAQSILTAEHLQNEQAAFAFLEARVWPHGPVCPHCGAMGRIKKLAGKTTRPGLWKCYDCMKPFTVKVGTVFESSHVALHLWLQAAHLMCSSKKGISSNQLHRTLGVTLKTAWFMSHRLREAMTTFGIEPLGGEGQTVEVDETYIGTKKGSKKPRGGGSHKNVVLALVERGGSVRSFHIDRASVPDILPIVRANINHESWLMTDEAKLYDKVGTQFAAHKTVHHAAGEYVRGDAFTNTVESYFLVFKRRMKGIYQHCGERHLHRYLSEFDFRHNNRVRLGVGDVERTDRALKGIVSKRLTYRTTRNSRRPEAAPV
jgi:transposase-like protein